MGKQRDIAILGFSGAKRERPVLGVVTPTPSTPVDEDEENRIMRDDDD